MQPNTVQKRAPRTGANRRNWNELIAELADLTAHELEAAGLSPEIARDVGVTVSDALAASFGGMLVYIPRNAAKQTAARDEEILRELGKVDAMTLATKYGMGMTSIYRAAHRAKARRKAGNAPQQAGQA